MCELLGLSAEQKVSFTCSLNRFAAHGSSTGRNHDGWGVSAYEGSDTRMVKEPTAAASSEWVRFIENHGVTSSIVIAHIRHASRGQPSYANTHPFCRELGGRVHTFAHNGTLPGVDRLALPADGFHPIGETDSEHAFCALLARLRQYWTGPRSPDPDTRRAVVADFAAEIAELGPANFLYSDGELLFAHGHRRQQEDGRVGPPGLHLIQREEIPADDSWLASGVDLGEHRDPVVLVASVPLTEEAWRPMAEGELAVVANGRLL